MNTYKSDGVPTLIGFRTSGENSHVAYGTDREASALGTGLIYGEDGNSGVNLEYWSSRAGAYRGWCYMPTDISKNAYSDDGKIVLRNLKNNPTDSFEWSGVFLETKGKLELHRNKVSVRMRFPSDADYYHATIWMLSVDSVMYGEIDIAEADSGNVTAAVHWKDEEGTLHSQLIGYYKVDSSEWHVYTLVWTEDSLVFNCDNKKIGVFDISACTYSDGRNPFNQPFYMVLNTNPYSTANKTFASGNSVTTKVDWLYVFEK